MKQYFNTGGVNTYVNPLLNDGALIHSVNMDSYPYGAKTKRPGYVTFLGTADGAQVNSLFAFNRNDGTTLHLYRASGSSLYHSVQGTGAWTLSGNGTISNGGHVGHAILDNTLIVGDGVGSTRHTTNGTAFTNTTLAPVAPEFEQYQNRIYAIGTSSDAFYSTTNDATNWNTSGTSDSSSLKIPGAGKLSKVFKAQDKVIFTKNTGLMYKWDGYSLIDMSTKLGPSSPYSVAQSEDYWFFANQLGDFGYGGGKPQLLSNAVQRQFYNHSGSAVAAATFKTMPGVVHKYDRMLALGTTTDDFTGREITNNILKYDFQKNEYLNYSFADNPTAFLSFIDGDAKQRLIFGDANGQCYEVSGTATTDNGDPIFSEMVFVFTYGAPEYPKKWNWWRGVFNPGCQAKVQIACSNTYTYQHLRWFDLGDVTDGIAEFRFPSGSTSRLVFVRIYEGSKDAPWTFYGQMMDATIEKK